MIGTRLTAAVWRALESAGVPDRGDTLLVGLSGGADSVALLDACVGLSRERGFRVVAAHLDHQLRASSAEDAAFCARLCEQLGVPLRVARADVGARAKRDGLGLEEAARHERYAFLRQAKDLEGAVAIAVAHTQDDQAETLLLRLLRGSGRTGLSAMRPRSADVVRPLLGVSRTRVLEHLRRRGLSWREDASNRDLAFARNRVRHELLPYLEARFNPRLRETLARCAELLADEAALLDSLVPALAERTQDGVTLDLGQLNGLPLPLRRLALRRALGDAFGLRGVSERHVERVLALAAAKDSSGRRVPLPGGRDAVVSFGALRVGSRRGPAQPFAFPLAVPGRVELPEGLALTAEPSAGPAMSRDALAVVPAPEQPLLVRSRRPGDRVRCRGREVSLKRFLMSRRVPADERAALPLVAAGRRVLWVPGQPVDVTEEGGRFVRLSLEQP